jgi:hypothetical protein
MHGLENAICKFNSALSQLGHSVGFETFTLVKGSNHSLPFIDAIDLHGAFHAIIGNLPQQTDPTLVDQFMVPFEENPNFIGRVSLLEELQTTLDDVTYKWNHRVALYGLGFHV